MQKMKTNYRDVRIATTGGFYTNLIGKFFTDKDYFFLIGKIIKIKILKQKTPIFAICDLNNSCNLKCKHCYWWLNRDNEKKELSPNDWRHIIRQKIKRNHILQVHLVGGEPLLRPDIIEVFNEELPGKFTMLTNGTKKLIPYNGLIVYGISIDGVKDTHDKIRGVTFDAIEHNVKEYVKKTGKKVWISMTINSWNFQDITKVAEYWKDLASTINFQFHTPFVENDPLWIPYGEKRDKILDDLIMLRERFPDYVINDKEQINLIRHPWGGDKNGPKDCPNWAIIAMDHQGLTKVPCCIGGSKKDDMMPMCENCGMSNYASLFTRGIHL